MRESYAPLKNDLSNHPSQGGGEALSVEAKEERT